MELNRAALVSKNYHGNILRENKGKDNQDINISIEGKEIKQNSEINMIKKVDNKEEASQLDNNLYKEASENENKENNKEKEIDNKKLNEAVEILNKLLKKRNTKIEFERHEVFSDLMFKIVDEETGDVITEAPPKSILDMVAKLCELAGVLVDKKV